nr:MAG TPA: hypothetical protein [Caudoviricetes sp.]
MRKRPSSGAAFAAKGGCRERPKRAVFAKIPGGPA